MTGMTMLLLWVAISAFQLSRSAGTGVGSQLLGGTLTVLVVVAVRVVACRRLKRASEKTCRLATTGVALTGALAVTCFSWSSILPLAGEEWILALLLCLAASIFVTRADNRARRSVATLSMTVVLFSLPGVAASHRLAVILAATTCGGLWLTAPAHARTSATAWKGVYTAGTLVLLVGAGLLAHHWIGPSGTENPSYAAWVPTSGGGDTGDENARRGTGDGPDEVGGASADSLGFDRGDTFSESAKDGLYDLWVESYGKPLTSQDQQKMIGLKPGDVRVVHGSDLENLKVGRTFDMRRERSRRPALTQRPDAAPDAKLWIKGPLPAYVPLAAFADFDGLTWQVIAAGKPSVPARLLPGTNWMEILHRPISPSFSGTSEHEIRVGTLGGDVLPLPPLVERFRMGRVNRPDFFASTRAGFVRLSNRNLPAGATLNAVSKNVSPSRLAGVEPALPQHTDPSLFDTHAVSSCVRDLAMQWGAGRPRGWRQIEQVIERLRGHVSPDIAGNTSAEDAVEELLFVKRKGPDYQIATSAVMLLRSLNYPTRLVSGLYADASDVDARSGFVPLRAENTHFWVEVRLADGTWVTVDPTPGYPMLHLPKTSGEWMAGIWNNARDTLSTHAVAFGSSAAAMFAIVLSRRRWINAFVTAHCRLGGYAPGAVLRVIELRACLVGRPRPAGMPVGRWLTCLPVVETSPEFVSTLNQHLYRDGPAASHNVRVIASGKNILNRLTLHTLKTHRPETT